MKTFKQFNEELPKPVTPKQLDVFKSDLRFIRTDDIRKKENQKFRSLYPFPRSMLDLVKKKTDIKTCLLYTSPSPRDLLKSRMPSSA